MRINKLWLKMAVITAATAVVGVLVATLLIRNSTNADFGSYLQHIGRMNQMMGGNAGNAGGMMGAPETEFLNSVHNSLWIAGGIAVAIAAIIALIFSRQITAPLRRLSLAASRVARGDLAYRVTPGSTDEVGTLTNTFNSMVESLEKNQDMRRKLMGDLAHEMGTPLAVIQSNLEGILDGVVEPSASNISSLHQEAMLLARLVKDLRTLSQVEAGKLNLSTAPGDIGALVSSIVTAADSEARRKNVSLSMDIPPDLPRAMMDRDRVSQVVVNLLSNALRYTSEGDSIKVTVAIKKGDGQPDQYLLVSVSDTGQGISEEELPHIFDRYYQGAQPKEKRSGGSGIGLTVVKELVEAHKGKVWVESAPGKGSTFFFILPAVPATQAKVTA
jgi:signal transduction histidine kinase